MNRVLSARFAQIRSLKVLTSMNMCSISEHKHKKFNLFGHCEVQQRPLTQRCSSCISLQLKNTFHTTSTKWKRRKTKEERKMVNVNKKALKTKSDNIVTIWKNMTVAELAQTLGRSIDDLFEIFLYIDDTDDYDQPYSVIDNLYVSQRAVKLAGLRFIVENPNVPVARENKDIHTRPPSDIKDTVPRAPVITIMGHVDHGKTTLLDSLRQSNIVGGEFGGITQHIGAFEVKLENGNEITFLDTPGHAAFSAMRSRGAHVTDVVVLVVAAEDGVMEQTKESIRMAKEAKVPMIVAINKIDKPSADIEMCKKMLLNSGIQLEGQGGDIQSVPISALKNINLDKLLDAILAQASIMDLRAEAKGLVEAVVIESKMEQGRGKVCTGLVNRGTLRKGAHLIAGTCHCKVRGLFNEYGKSIESVKPGKPAQIMGWRDLPSAGDEILEVESEKKAKEVIDYRKRELSTIKANEDLVVIQKKLDEHIQEHREKVREKRKLGIRYKRWRGVPPREKLIQWDNSPKVSMILKGDVDGSLEALLDVIETYHSDECPVQLVSYGVGPVNEGDVTLADTFGGSVYAFNVDVDRNAQLLAKKKSIPIHKHNIIYRLIETLQEDISNRLPMKDVEEILGVADVIQEFLVTAARKKVPVAGCRCIKGQLTKDGNYRLERSLQVVYEGTLSSLKHLKNEVNAVKKDVECGLALDNPQIRFQAGDTVVCYRINKIAQKTDWHPPGF